MASQRRYNQPIATGHDQMHQLLNAWRPRLISEDFFGNGRVKAWGIYVIVPEGYQYRPGPLLK
jgi:hypothetical protein